MFKLTITFTVSKLNKLILIGYILLVMSLIDAILTDYGLRLNLIDEANPLMRFAYESNVGYFYSIKLLLPIFLLLILRKLESTRLLKGMLFVTTGLYGIVMLIHVAWIFLSLTV